MTAFTIPRQNLFAHVPYHRFPALAPFLVEQGIQPELYFSAPDLESVDRREARRLSRCLRGAGLRCTFHAPFLELNPGALDEKVRRLTLERHRELLALAPLFEPATIVFHPGWDRWRYDHVLENWLTPCVKTWRPLLKAAGRLAPGARLALENIYDTGPESLAALANALNDPAVGFCFDTGHFHLFAEAKRSAWLDILGPRITQLHLHDNHGDRDAHLPLGEGTFPFPSFFAELAERGIRPAAVTLEAHSEEHLARSRAALERLARVTG